MIIHCKYDTLVKVDYLKPYPRNRNKHTEEQITRLAELLKYQGVRSPIVVDALDERTIVKGHGTLAAITKNGWNEAPVVYQKFDDEEQRYAYVQSDNAIGAWSELDLAAINLDLPELGPDFNVDMLGIKDFVLEPADKYGDKNADEIPETRATDIKSGDLFSLGNHRLYCGDSALASNVDTLMNGEKADMVFTDPPYGVNYDGGTTKQRKLENDDSDAMYAVACEMGFRFSKPDAPLYMWHAGTMSAAAAAVAAGWVIRSHIIWNKNMAQFGALSAQYKQKHEPAFYCYKKGKTVNWSGPTNEVTVWDCRRESKNEFHPTQKPVELAERAMGNHNVKLLFEPFCGSGSTLIACEKTNRKCYGMEIDPLYCQVIIDRWEKFTGQKAVKL